MHYHVCRFSKHVKRSYHIPAPRDDAKGYIDGVMQAIRECDIDLVIPMHEEIFYLAEEAQTNPELRSKLLSPPFHTLIMLHNKWEFSQFLQQNSLGVPKSSLCKSYEDVLALGRDVEWAVKPVYGRANTSVFHLEPGKPLPTEEEIDISDGQHYIAQEWVKGQRFCTYSVLWNGKVSSLSVYPVQDTIDGEPPAMTAVRNWTDRLGRFILRVFRIHREPEDYGVRREARLLPTRGVGSGCLGRHPKRP
jgi:hypothetical protein